MLSKNRRDLGATLRTLRKEQGYTLAQVAQETGLSKSFISLLEAGKSDITIGRLLRLSSFYGIHAGDLLPQPNNGGATIVRTSERPQIESIQEGIDVRLLARQRNRKMTPTLAIFEAGGASAEYYQHVGDEFLFVMTGQINLSFEDGEVDLLEAGDSAYFRADRPHRYTNTSDQASVVLMVVTPPTL